MDSYADISRDDGYDQLSFEDIDAEDCLYSCHMQLPSLSDVSDQDKDKPFRLMKQKRRWFEYSNLNDEKSQIYQIILSKTEEETSRIQELFEHVESLDSEDFYVDFINLRIKITIHMLKKGIEFASKSYKAQGNFTSEMKEYIDNLFLFQERL